MSIITCLPDNRLIEVKSSETVLEGLLNDGINHANVCGGQGNCSTCRVMILDGIGKCSWEHLTYAMSINTYGDKRK
jgi:adenylate cyclase